MANYLERVATSAGRRAAIAKPPNNGPPVLPAGRDFSLALEEPFMSDQDQFLEPLETPMTARAEEYTPTPAPKLEGAQELPGAPQDAPVVAAAEEPKSKPRRPTHERLSSEAPFTVHVPRTLRPASTATVSPIVKNEPAREPPRAQASSTVGPGDTRVEEEPVPLVRFSDVEIADVKPPVPAPVETKALPLRPKPHVTEPGEKYRTPEPRSEDELSDSTPVPRVDRVDGPTNIELQSADPSPPPALPVHLPPAGGNAARQEQSRISIGSLEVLVNNHPRAQTLRPSVVQSRNEGLNLEKRYLDRFRLRH